MIFGMCHQKKANKSKSRRDTTWNFNFSVQQRKQPAVQMHCVHWRKYLPCISGISRQDTRVSPTWWKFVLHLCFYERSMLVPVFCDWKKSEEDCCFYKKAVTVLMLDFSKSRWHDAVSGSGGHSQLDTMSACKRFHRNVLLLDRDLCDELQQLTKKQQQQQQQNLIKCRQRIWVNISPK